MPGVQNCVGAGPLLSWFFPLVQSSYGGRCGIMLYYAHCSQRNGKAGREVYLGQEEETDRGTTGVSDAKGGVPDAPCFGLHCSPLDQGGHFACLQGGPRMAHKRDGDA